MLFIMLYCYKFVSYKQHNILVIILYCYKCVRYKQQNILFHYVTLLSMCDVCMIYFTSHIIHYNVVFSQIVSLFR